MGRHLRGVTSSLAALLACMTQLPSAAAMGRVPSEAVADQLAEYRRVLLSYFKAFDLLPIVLPAGQRPGDVFDLRQKGVLRSRAEECFPGLVQPAPVPSALAYTFQLDSTKTGLGLGLPSLASLDFGSEFERSVTVSYTDVKVVAVSQQALEASVSDACKDVAAVVRQADVPLAGPPPALLAVVGTLVTAKRAVFIGATRSGDLKASVDKIGTALMAAGIGPTLKVLGLDPSMSVALGFGSKSGVLVQSDQELPVAFMPAFLPEVLFASVQGAPSSEPNAPRSLRWKPFDPADATSTRLLGSLVDDALKQ